MKRIAIITVFLFLTLTLLGAGKIIDICVEGVQKTKPSVVVNLSGISIGDEYDIEKIYLAKRTLQESGLFSDVYMQIRETEGGYRLIITVEEENTIYPYFGPYLALGVGDRNLLGSGVNLYGGLRFVRFTDKKLLGFLPVPQLFWGGITLGGRYPKVFGSAIDLNFEVTLFKEAPWQTDVLLTLNRFKLGGSSSIGDYGVGLSYSYESATFDASPSNDYGVSILTAGLSFGDPVNYRQERANLYGMTTLSYGFGGGRSYLQHTAQIDFWYRIIGRIYASSKTKIGITYLGSAPVTKQYYLGGSQDLKGWNSYSFNPRHFIFQVLEAGVPLTENFGIAPSDELSTYIPKLYIMGAAGFEKTFGLAIGIGLEWRTPLGIAIEPQIFFGGDGFKFYFELR